MWITESKTYHFQIEIKAELGLTLTLTGVKEEHHMFVQGLAGGSQSGNLESRNGTLYANDSTEKELYTFGNSC